MAGTVPTKKISFSIILYCTNFMYRLCHNKCSPVIVPSYKFRPEYNLRRNTKLLLGPCHSIPPTPSMYPGSYKLYTINDAWLQPPPAVKLLVKLLLQPPLYFVGCLKTKPVCFSPRLRPERDLWGLVVGPRADLTAVQLRPVYNLPRGGVHATIPRHQSGGNRNYKNWTRSTGLVETKLLPAMDWNICCVKSVGEAWRPVPYFPPGQNRIQGH